MHAICSVVVNSRACYSPPPPLSEGKYLKAFGLWARSLRIYLNRKDLSSATLFSTTYGVISCRPTGCAGFDSFGLTPFLPANEGLFARSLRCPDPDPAPTLGSCG